MFKRKAKPQNVLTYTLTDLILDEKRLKDLTPTELLALYGDTNVTSAVFGHIQEEITHRIVLGRPKTGDK